IFCSNYAISPEFPSLSLHDALPICVSLLQGAADTYQELRRYLEAAAAWDRALAITPSAVTLRVRRAQVDLESRADTQPMQEVIRSEEHTSELQSRSDLVCRLLLEKK